jgi:hypothetical protein
MPFSRLVRLPLRLAAALAVIFGMSLGTASMAAAAPVSCASPASPNDIQVADEASCGAMASEGGVARASAVESGTAVSVASDAGSLTRTRATGTGTALAAAETGGQAHAVALGGGIARARAIGGATTLAWAGWGSGATVDEFGVQCVGPFSLALNLGTGAFCALG